MKKREMMWKKMMLGFLTMGDLREIVPLEGEFTFGKHWLPIAGTRRRNREIQFWMEDEWWVEFSVPVDTVVKVAGNTVRIPVERHNIRGGDDDLEVVIRLDREPFAEY
jgi:hypothetical protein